MSSREAWLSARYDNEKKSLLIAYLLVFFGLGWFGVHRIYCGRLGSGITMAALGVVGIILGVLSLGLLWIPFLVVFGPWIFIDLFLLPGIVESHNAELADSYFLPAARREPDHSSRSATEFREVRRNEGPFAVRLHPSDRIGR